MGGTPPRPPADNDSPACAAAEETAATVAAETATDADRGAAAEVGDTPDDFGTPPLPPPFFLGTAVFLTAGAGGAAVVGTTICPDESKVFVLIFRKMQRQKGI